MRAAVGENALVTGPVQHQRVDHGGPDRLRPTLIMIFGEDS
ncbi:hypothetical protein [Nocardia sp. R6R-6]